MLKNAHLLHKNFLPTFSPTQLFEILALTWAQSCQGQALRAATPALTAALLQGFYLFKLASQKRKVRFGNYKDQFL